MSTKPAASMTLRRVAFAALLGLLAVLSLRLTMTETLRQPLSQKYLEFTASRSGKPVELRAIGPSVTLWMAAMTLLLSAVGAGCAARAGAMTRRHAGMLALIVLVVAI